METNKPAESTSRQELRPPTRAPAVLRFGDHYLKCLECGCVVLSPCSSENGQAEFCQYNPNSGLQVSPD